MLIFDYIVYAVALLLLTTWLGIIYSKSVDGWAKFHPLSDEPTSEDERFQQMFAEASGNVCDRYNLLFMYFLRGFVENVDIYGSRVNYLGFPSVRGYSVTGIEGFARTAPLIGAWLYSGRSQSISDYITREKVDLVALLRRALLAGTDPSSLGYWGDCQNNDQRIVEAADIARVLWLTRELIWDKLTVAEQDQVAGWLLQVQQAAIKRRNNWILFPVVVLAFLKSVNYINEYSSSNYFEFKSNYVDYGFFTDGPDGDVDYYNMWGIAYDLFWIHTMDPNLDSIFLRNTLVTLGENCTYFVSPTGLPIMGRSVCYRTAVPSPILIAARLSPETVHPGLALRSLDVVWSYFVGAGILRQGTMTMGYFGNDPRMVDNYTGPGSSHWGLRSLTLAFMSCGSDSFWTNKQELLPIERKNFELKLPKIGWQIKGDFLSGVLTLSILKNQTSSVTVESYGLKQRFIEIIYRRPRRPKNYKIKYGLHSYKSDPPFAGLLDSGS